MNTVKEEEEEPGLPWFHSGKLTCLTNDVP
jgi:hypothetical protein